VRDLTFRPLAAANDAEVAAVVALVNHCYRGGASWTDESAIVDGRRVTPERLRDYAATSDVLVVVAPAPAPAAAATAAAAAHGANGAHDGGGTAAADGAPIIGVVKTGWTDETVVGPLDGRAYYLGLLAVAPTWQSRGVGAALADRVEAAAAAAGASRVVMDVIDARPELLAWYARRGYRRTGGGMPARAFIEAKGERLLVDCRFIVLEKVL